MLSAFLFLAVATSPNPVARLEPWIGRWTFSGNIYKTAFSQPHADTGITDCRWSPNNGYVICDFFSDNPPHDDLSIITYNESTKGYTVDLVHKDGRKASSETILASGNTWVSSREMTDSGKIIIFRTTFVFVTPTKQTTLVEVSSDKGHTWSKMIFVTAVKA